MHEPRSFHELGTFNWYMKRLEEIMRVGILTFQFAINYGAMLQAYALKKYLSQPGINAELVPYYPEKFRIQYSTSPIESGLTIKKRIKNLYLYPYRAKQIQKFLSFKDQYLYGDNVNESPNFPSLARNYDCLLFGSDQIWNTEISFNDPAYFGAGTSGPKIAYAASFGTSSLNDSQLQFVKKYLPDFSSVSVREPASKLLLHENGIESEVVCDPVFLLSTQEWREMEESVRKIHKKYVLLYMLSNDDKLLAEAKKYARANACDVYAIHPTLELRQSGVEMLEDVGPKEFLWLIDHAECVATNSFHAVSFSIIFKRHLLHIPNKKSPGRTISLLHELNFDCDQRQLLDAETKRADFEKYTKVIDESKKYLCDSIELVEEC